MKQIDLAEAIENSQSRVSFYDRTLEDIDAHERALAQEIEQLQSARQQLLHLKAQLPDVAASRCIFCGGKCRDLSTVIENSGAFRCLGSGALAIDHESSYRPVPLRWECQKCGAFDIDSPDGAKIWGREQILGPKTLWRQILNAFPAAGAIALEESSHGTLWMLQVANTWYLLPGSGAQIAEQLRSHSAKQKEETHIKQVSEAQIKIQKSVPSHQLFKRQSNDEDIFVYEALIQLDCEQCNRAIEAYELFSRSADKKGQIYGIRYNQCRECVPFKLDLTME